MRGCGEGSVVCDKGEGSVDPGGHCPGRTLTLPLGAGGRGAGGPGGRVRFPEETCGPDSFVSTMETERPDNSFTFFWFWGPSFLF